MVKQTQCKKGQSWDMGTRKPWTNWRPLPNNLPYTLDPKRLHSSTSLKHLPYNIHEVKLILTWEMSHHFWFPPCVALTVNCVLEHGGNIAHVAKQVCFWEQPTVHLHVHVHKFESIKTQIQWVPFPVQRRAWYLWEVIHSAIHFSWAPTVCIAVVLEIQSGGLGSSEERMEVQTKIEASRWNKVARIENWRRGNQKAFVIDYMWKTSVREELRMTARWLGGW